LGLKLEAAKGPVTFLAIDHAEKPHIARRGFGGSFSRSSIGVAVIERSFPRNQL